MAEHAHTTPAPTLAPPPLSRRGFLSGATTAAIAGAALVTAVHAEPPGDDAELLAALVAFDALEHEINATYKASDDSLEAEEAADLVREPLHDRQVALLARIYRLRATTLEGMRARARSLMLWDNDMASAVRGGDPGDYWDDKMVVALVRDLTEWTAA